MPNVSSFGAQTDNAVVSGTVTDRQMVIPEVPPQGLMSIGPRQSPNYIKEPWNAQTSYVFYDVVKDGAGASYVATKPVVPAGTALTDENYWFKWADPNAQINELNEVVKTFNERIAQNASAITAEVARATAAEQAEERRATAAEATKAPVNHASEETIYGIGNEANYGHVKLAADDTPLTSGANDGIAATPKFISNSITNSKNIRTIEDYGCSTSAPNNAEKLQAAINDCAEKGYILIVPKGTYNCDAPISIPWHTYLFGVGKESVIKFTSDCGFFSPVDKHGYKVSADVCVKHMSIIGPLSKVAKTFNDEHAGIIGMFTSCEMEDLFIKNFEVGIKLNQNVQQPDYNDKYNHVFGDLRSWKNISVDSCNMGIKNSQWDTFFDSVAIASCWSSMISGYFVNNLHIWGCRSGLYAESGYFNNIEIESQQVNNEIADSFIVINTNGTVALNNVKLWNVFIDSNVTYSHAYIRGDDAHNGIAIISNLLISEDQNEPTKLKKPIIRLNKLYAIVQGGISKTITGLATGFSGAPTSACIGSGGYAQGNLLANFELTGAIDISKTTGYHTVTTS